MYNKGDYVVKIPEGICQIENVGHADGRIRHIITKDDAMKFIKSIPDISKKDFSDEKLREQEYKSAILSGDHVKIVKFTSDFFNLYHGSNIIKTRNNHQNDYQRYCQYDCPSLCKFRLF